MYIQACFRSLYKNRRNERAYIIEQKIADSKLLIYQLFFGIILVFLKK
jgi:hypothetical protein